MPQPKRIYSVLIPFLVVAFLVSAVGGRKTPSDGGLYWVGATGWFAFCVSLLVTAGYSVFVLATRSRRRRASGTTA